MKLDTKALRYLTAEDWRVLTAVEMGSKNHELVPTSLIAQIANLRGSGAVHKSISTLAKSNLISRLKNAKYDGYRLTYGGLDYLALHTHLKRQTLYSTGSQIGTGKESDIHAVAAPDGTQLALKIHRLGRISFRTIKTNRDYLRHRTAASWLYMSRLAALKEFTFLTALSQNGFPVPRPVAQSRHTLVMELVQALPLRQVSEVPDPAGLYAELVEMVLRLAEVGLIHGDFNEFNILIREDEVVPAVASTASSSPPIKTITPILIDFPQMVSIDHVNAETYFDRDIICIKRFFARRFHFVSDESGPSFADARKRAERKSRKRVDVEVEASGFSRKMARELERYMQAVGMDGGGGSDEAVGEGESEPGNSTDDEGLQAEDKDADSSFDGNPSHGKESTKAPCNLEEGEEALGLDRKLRL